MSQRFFNPAPQYFYSGTPAAPLSGGLMYFYESGTSTPKDTYSDNGLSVPNTNPVVLSSSGVLPNVFLDGSYRVTLTDRNGVQQPGWPRDSVNSVVDIAFAAWDNTATYGLGGTNIVYASNGDYYVSIQANNTGHEPSASPLWWKPMFDYLAEGQTIITAGYVVIGSASTGLAGVNINTKGSIIAGNGTIPAALPVGANNLVLTADSAEVTGLKWSSQAQSMVLLSTVTASNSATVDIETTFSSSYDNYVILCSGVVPQTDNTDMQIRLKVGGSYDTGNNYSYALIFKDDSQAGGTISGDGASAQAQIVMGSNLSNDAGATWDAQFSLSNPASTTLKKTLSWNARNVNTTPATVFETGAGSNVAVTALTGVRFFMSSGNITSGKFRLYGITNT